MLGTGWEITTLGEVDKENPLCAMFDVLREFRHLIPTPSSFFFTLKRLQAKYDLPCECVAIIEEGEQILLNASTHSETITSEGDASATNPPVTLEKAGPRKKLFFDPKNVVAGIVTCGGLCPAINNVIRAIVNCLLFRYGVKKVIGFRYGFEGMIPGNHDYIELKAETVRDIHQFGGSFLGSSRGPQNIGAMVDNLVNLGVNMLFTIGGDGTQRGAEAIANEVIKRGLQISVVGVPKTIDNDIAFVERTFGFETAVEKAQASIMAAHEEARSAMNGIGIVKLMGRESGFIALHAAIASGDVNILLLPEVKFSMDYLVNCIKNRLSERRHILVVVAEGAGQDMTGGGREKDISGNPIFSDIAIYLKNEIGRRLKAEKMEHTIKLIDPSYSIRSAVAVSSDAIFALQLGQMACHAAMAGKTNLIVGAVHNRFVHLPISRAVQFRKKVDTNGLVYQSFLDASGMPADLCKL
ncbi:hypothetical protein HDU76_000814 [Blyttiomyces sp. JEL0837]|nr:hypothetical protein HDU76_000814 [Blyttiomyces sp. JEL0837]